VKASADSLALTSVSAAANVRASCGRQALANLNKLLSLVTDSLYRQASYVKTLSSVRCVVDHTQLLAYGTVRATMREPYAPHTPPVENGAPSVLDAGAGARVYTALFGDACPFIATASPATFSVPDCETFSSGIVRLGLAKLVDVWATKFALLGDAKLRTALAVGGLDEGAGFETPSSAFNYSKIACARDTPPPSEECMVFAAAGGPPADGSARPPSPLSDATFVGDVGVSDASTVLPPGTTPRAIRDFFESAEFQWCVIVTGTMHAHGRAAQSDALMR
jgi:hypothetical protein